MFHLNLPRRNLGAYNVWALQGGRGYWSTSNLRSHEQPGHRCTRFEAESLQEIQRGPITHGECASCRRDRTWHLLGGCESPLHLAAIQGRIVLLKKRVESHRKHHILQMITESFDLLLCNLIYTSVSPKISVP